MSLGAYSRERERPNRGHESNFLPCLVLGEYHQPWNHSFFILFFLFKEIILHSHTRTLTGSSPGSPKVNPSLSVPHMNSLWALRSSLWRRSYPPRIITTLKDGVKRGPESQIQPGHGDNGHHTATSNCVLLTSQFLRLLIQLP